MHRPAEPVTEWRIPPGNTFISALRNAHLCVGARSGARAPAERFALQKRRTPSNLGRCGGSGSLSDVRALMPEQKLLVTQQYARPKHAQASRGQVEGMESGKSVRRAVQSR